MTFGKVKIIGTRRILWPEIQKLVIVRNYCKPKSGSYLVTLVVNILIAG